MDIPPATDPLVPPLAVPVDELTEKLAEDEEMQEVPPDTTITPGASSSSRDEKRTEAQAATSHDEVINREANSHVCRPACQTTTDKRNRHEERRGAHASGDRRFVSVVNTVNTLLSDESGVETNPWTDDSRQTNS